MLIPVILWSGVVVNAIAFDIVWLGLVYYQNAFIPFALLFLVMHCVLFLKGRSELILIAKLVLIGTLIDSALIALGDGSLGANPDSAEEHVGRDVERPPVGSEGAVGGSLTR